VQTERALAAFSLTTANLAPDLPPALVSTGLRYLVVPISSGLAEAQIAQHPQLGHLLTAATVEFPLMVVVGSEGSHLLAPVEANHSG
jgi:trans-2,3-dihydro-3-hydroxyanthranilate isomerase